MPALVFSMSGEVRGKGRPRLSTRGGFARAFTDAKTRAYESSIRKIATAAMAGHALFEGPLSASFQFRITPPPSMPKYRRERILAGEDTYLGRIDCDNAVKACLDAMNGVCFADDKQIVRLFATKIASEKPGVDVRIEALTP